MKNAGTLGVGALLVAMFGGLLTIVVILGGANHAASACTPGAGVPGSAVSGTLPEAVGPWRGEQLRNAAAIINAGAEAGVPRLGQVIGVMTAMGESGLRVLDYGDAAGPDSRGLFQQRSNGAWGSLADRMNPRTSSLNFFRALMRIPGWSSLPPTIAAHRTQRNADPYYYEPYFDDATDVVAALVPVQPGGAIGAGGGDPYHLGPVKPQLRALVSVLAPMFAIRTVGGYRPSANDPKGHPLGLAADFMVPLTAAGRAQGDALTTYARRYAEQLGVDYILWQQQIWSLDRAREGWRPMGDRGSPTQNHLDHVHINVRPDAVVQVAGLPGAGASVIDAATGAGPGSAATQGGFSGVTAAACAALAGQGGTVGPPGAVVYPVDKSTDRRNWHTTSPLRASWHTGTDFSIACGTPVLAAHGGRVSIEGTNWAGPHLTKISTGPASLTTWYGHMATVTVRAGDVVTAGQQIGTVGSLGNSTGCHLHFEVHERNGSIYGPDNVNPTLWLAANVGTTPGPAASSTPAPVVRRTSATGGTSRTSSRTPERSIR